MKVITARNVQEALPLGIEFLLKEGVKRESRNGPVLKSRTPVTTVYTHPTERVLFWPQRDANPFFHLYESLWMLAGRNDIKGVAHYASNMLNYSDDGVTQHGAYGHRWRNAAKTEYVDWGANAGDVVTYDLDQLAIIANRLAHNPEDRRCVLQMWDANRDLGRQGKDFPCNIATTFQRDEAGRLDLVVFNRSNDVVWGAYGANAVHFSFLLEYMARWIGCEVGTYSQISVNYHGYLTTLDKVRTIQPDRLRYIPNPYAQGFVRTIPLFEPGNVRSFDTFLKMLLARLDADDFNGTDFHDAFFDMAWTMFRAHHRWRQPVPLDIRFREATAILNTQDSQIDWIRAAHEWIHRRAIAQASHP